MNRGGYKQYNQVQIKTANRGKLIVMLYQGAIRFMKKAILHLEQRDMEAKGNALIRAQDIILELTYALDQESLDRGDELALNLQRLYLYSYRRLVPGQWAPTGSPLPLSWCALHSHSHSVVATHLVL